MPAIAVHNNTLYPITMPPIYGGAIVRGRGTIVINDTLANVKAALERGDTTAGLFSYDTAATGQKNAVTPRAGHAQVFDLGTPATKGTNNVHASVAGTVGRATLNCATIGDGVYDAVLSAKGTARDGAAGNNIRVVLSGTGAGGSGAVVTEDLVNKIVTITYEDNVSTVTTINTALGSATLVAVTTAGTGANKPRAATTDGFGLTSGGVTNPTFGGTFTSPDVPRNLRVIFATSWDSGDVVVSGTNQFDERISESFVGASNQTRVGSKIFKTVTSAYKTKTGENAAGVTVGTGDKLGVPAKLADDNLLSLVANALDAPTVDVTLSGYTPTALPNGSAAYVCVANV